MVFVRLLLVALAATTFAGTAAAAEPIRLLSDYALSPDGSRIVFAWAGDLWSVSSEGGAATRLTTDAASDRNPRFSPDGEELAFISSRSGSNQIHTMPASGGVPTQHTRHTEGYRLEEYLPDGSGFLASGSRDHFWRDTTRFFTVPRGGKTAEKLLFDAAGYAGRLSPDGNRLLFMREGTSWFRKGYEGSQAAQIWEFDRRTGEFTQLLADQLGFRSPRWKSDGSGFYYVGQQSGSFNLWQYVDGETEQLTFFDDDAVFAPQVSVDGSVIIFAHLFDLYRFEPGSSRPPQKLEITNLGDPVRTEVQRRNLTRADEATVTSDALEIAFIAGGDVWVMDTVLREPRRVTDTPEEERDVVFSPDNSQLFFVSDRGGQSDIWCATRSDDEQFWWQNEEFNLERRTQDPEVERYLSLLPDGERLAFVRGRGDLMIMDLDGKNRRRLVESWNAPGYDFSPDSRWVVYAVDDNDFNRDVWVRPLDDSRPPFNISVHPDNDRGPTWSPDGRTIAWTGRRTDDETDIHYVYLRAEDHDEDSRDRTLDKALQKMKKRKPAKKAADGKKASKGEAAKQAKAKKGADKKNADAKPDEADDEDRVVIDFEDLRDRIRTISIRNSRESSLRWVGDRKLAFTGTVDGSTGAYTVTFPDELRPKKLASATTRGSIPIPSAKVLALVSGGQPATLSYSGKLEKFAFTARQEIRPEERYRAGFLVAWRAMRDGFYDANLGNRNWDEIRRKYIEAAAAATDDTAFARVVSLMLGELNGSHLGFSGRGGRSGPDPDLQWNELTGHLGLRYDPNYKGPGWLVKDVIDGGPAAEAEVGIEAGDVVLAIDGTTVDPSMPVESVLTGFQARDIAVRVRRGEAEPREVTLRPTTYAGIRRMLYSRWTEGNQELVEEQSGGRLGYLHIRGMNWSSFLKFELELFKVGHNKDGLIIDVRANGGGSTADHLLTVLTQPQHAMTVPRGGGRGYPQDRRVYATWHKPIVVLCDQDSFSNAEIFSHAIKTLGRGRLVGMPTAGGVISTGRASVMDLGSIRMPFRGWYLLDGEDMELNGAVPHFLVPRLPGEWQSGRDGQLAKAIEVLREDVAEYEARPQPALMPASERGASPVREIRNSKTREKHMRERRVRF